MAETEDVTGESEDTIPEDVSRGSDSGEITEPSTQGSVEEDRFERRWTKRSGKRQDPPHSTIEAEAATDASGDLEKERKRANDLFERLQRSMADLSNYRKRAEQERDEVTKFASMVLVMELLPVLDNFERALAAIPQELQHFTWLQGIALIERHLRAILEHQGVEVIEAVGKPFNPSLHEAIVEEESSEVEPGSIVADLQTGYTMHGRVIRPTMARVAKAPTSVAATEDETTDEKMDPSHEKAVQAHVGADQE